MCEVFFCINACTQTIPADIGADVLTHIMLAKLPMSADVGSTSANVGLCWSTSAYVGPRRPIWGGE